MVRALKDKRQHQGDLQKSLGDSKNREQVLSQKKGRKSQFKSGSERDRWIRQQVSALSTGRDMKVQNVEDVEEELRDINRDLTQ